MTGDTTPQDHATALRIAHAALRDNGIIGPGVLYATGAAVKALADAGLLCSSPVQPENEDGSLRSVPSAPGPQWAVLRPDDHNIYTAEASARRVLSFLDQDGEQGYRVYEVREAP